MDSVEEYPAAFILSLIAGVLIIVGGIVAGVWFSFGTPSFTGMMGSGMMSGMMGGYTGMMGTFGFGTGYLTALAALGFVSGVVVLLGAFMLRSRPQEASTWGALVLAFSVVSFLGMGGFYVGAVLGVVGGVIALTLRPSIRQAQP